MDSPNPWRCSVEDVAVSEVPATPLQEPATLTKPATGTEWDEKRFLAEATRLGRIVDKALAAECHDTEPVPALHEGMTYALGMDPEGGDARGKRIRPVLCLLVSEALGGSVNQALPFATAIEMLHNFALVHDDIEDGDTQRRGRDSVHVRFGLAHGINIGDYMLARVFRHLHEAPEWDGPLRRSLLALLDETLEELFSGQALDIEARSRRSFTRREYTELVDRKTGSYLAAPLIGGALIAGAPQAVLSALRELGSALGPLFQIRDDLIDLTADKGRGQAGNDIREGKRSFLVACVAEKCSPAEHDRLFTLLDTPREETAPADVEEVIALYHRHGVVEEAEAYCEELRHRAEESIRPLPRELSGLLSTVTMLLARRTR